MARSIPTTSTPVAIGSSVPACPTLRVPKMRLHPTTTSWLVIPEGLSTTPPRRGVGHSTIAVSASPSRTDQRPRSVFNGGPDNAAGSIRIRDCETARGPAAVDGRR